MRLRLVVLSPLVLAAALLAAPASADGFITPSIGDNFGGDAGRCPSATQCSSKHLTYGIAAGFMYGGVIGLEEELSYAPHFFGDITPFGNNSVLTLMSNVIVGAPLGPIRPYVIGGLGMVRSSVNFAPGGLATFEDTGLGYDLGGGLMAGIAPHVALRADYRYIRGAKDITIAGFSIDNTALRFSRATVGVAFTF